MKFFVPYRMIKLAWKRATTLTYSQTHLWEKDFNLLEWNRLTLIKEYLEMGEDIVSSQTYFSSHKS